MLIYYALEKFELYCQKKVGIHKTIREQHLINKVCENTHTQKKPKTKNQTLRKGDQICGMFFWNSLAFSMIQQMLAI